MAKIIELILTSDLKGKGETKDPYRRVWQLFTKDGKLIAEETNKWDKGYFLPREISWHEKI